MAPLGARNASSGTSVNLLIANRAIICVDPKGENARVAARARARFGRVHVLDPFEISGAA